MTSVTLTFDNGPTPGVTERVLDILSERDLPAAFFMIGRQLLQDGGPQVLREVAAAGHVVGNHSLTHSVALGDKPDAAYAEREIGETFGLLGEFAHPNRFFRPFGNFGLVGPHLLSESAVDHLLRERCTTVLWHSVPHDWDDPDGWVERLLTDVQRQDHTVAVLHDIEGACLPRLDELLDRLAEQGTQFGTAFPDDIVLTREGHRVNLLPSYVSGGAQ
jgi:peptidoglycan/xylan/chitin deacetylase (PgdA/CDA1 family)